MKKKKGLACGLNGPDQTKSSQTHLNAGLNEVSLFRPTLCKLWFDSPWLTHLTPLITNHHSPLTIVSIIDYHLSLLTIIYHHPQLLTTISHLWHHQPLHAIVDYCPHSITVVDHCSLPSFTIDYHPSPHHRH